MSTRVSQTIGRGAAANSTRRTQGQISVDPGGATVKATTISFTGPNTIADSGNGFGALRVGDTIQVRGSALNSRSWDVATAAAGSITTVQQLVTTEAAGPQITVTRVH